jgi:hypothetical protein
MKNRGKGATQINREGPRKPAPKKSVLRDALRGAKKVGRK